MEALTRNKRDKIIKLIRKISCKVEDECKSGNYSKSDLGGWYALNDILIDTEDKLEDFIKKHG